MPHNRFYCPSPLEPHQEVLLEETELRHMHVMRLSAGDEVELIDGKGKLAAAEIVSLEKKRARLKISNLQTQPPEPAQILLGIPLLRPSKLEWVIEKGTELGVDTFFLYPAELGEKQALSSKQLERLRLLTLCAIKQSGHLFLPHLEILPSLSSLLTKSPHIYYGDTSSNAAPLAMKLPALFITGPESGFSEKEISELQQAAQGVQLSAFILRAETAPLAAASLLSWQKLFF